MISGLKKRYVGSHLVCYSIAAALCGSIFFVPEARAQAHEYVPGEVIIKLRGKSKSIESKAFIGKAVAEKAMALKGSWGGTNMYHFGLKPGQSVESAIADLKADPEVEYAEPNYIVRRQSAGREGDPMAMNAVREQAAGDSVSTYSQTSAPIHMQDAWAAASAGKPAAVVAVIDTGVDFNHDVFVSSGAIWSNEDETVNGIDDDGNGFIDDVRGWNFVANSNSPLDDDGHGTHVAGIILGTTQDISAYSLAASKVKIMPLKFLDANGSGTTSDAIKAIYYAVNNGAQVLNNSWGGGGFSNALQDAIAYSYNHKVVFVAAAGNASSNNDQSATYPANYDVPNVISIAATSDLDALAGFSNYGAQTVHMGSPGVSIWSTLPGDLYGRSSGTSMAAPFVAGVASLMVREAPGMSGYQIKSLIFNGAQSISSLQTKTITRSRLDALNSLMNAKSTSVDPNQPSYDASASRSPSTALAEPPPGCGLVVKALYDSSKGGGGPSGPQKNVAFFALLVLLIAPIAVSVALRQRSGKNQRRHTRYQIDSQVKLRFGDRELVGHVSTISLGGVQLNTDAWLDNGGIVKMSIRSPDGRDEIEVEGKVVWSEEHKRYGVAFANAQENVLSSIGRWTQNLLKA